MDDHEEDIKKLDEILKQESQCNNTFEEELQDCLNYNISDEEELEGYESDSSFNLDVSENALTQDESKFFDIDTMNFSTDLSSIKHYLTVEELKVISSCKDSKLKRILLLNRAKHVHLKATQRKLYEKLKECTEAMSKARQSNRNTTGFGPGKHNIMARVGYPYFKTVDNFLCSPNADTERKKQRKEVCLDYLARLNQWTVGDRIILKRCACFQYTNERIKEYEIKLDQLNAEKLDCTSADKLDKIKADIEESEEYIKKYSRPDVEQDIPPLDYEQINWISIAEVLNGRHKDTSCMGMWKTVLHPAIDDKTPFSDEENNSILRLAKTYHNQNWDKIAAELKTNRSGFLVYMHFQSKLNAKQSVDKFGPDEDRYLHEVVESCRVGNYIPWSKVAQYFDNRSRRQLYSRYLNINLISQNIHKRGMFSEEEDILLLILLKRFGTRYSRIGEYLPNRTRIQVTHRIRNSLLADGHKHGSWSVSDDNTIMRHVDENGPKNWSKLIEKMPLRNSGQIRHRYLQIQKWLSRNPGKTLEDIERKECSKKLIGRFEPNLPLLKQFADMFDDYVDIPTLDEVREKMKMCGYKRSQRIRGQYFNTTVDEELIQFFQSSHKVRSAHVVTKSDFAIATKTVKGLLAMLNVTLNIPDKESLSKNILLDDVDKEILSQIFVNAYAQYDNAALNSNQVKIDYKVNDKSVSLIPPNINSLVGMRSMLLKFGLFKTKISKTSSYSSKKNLIKEQISQDLLRKPLAIQHLVKSERIDFKERLRILFTWPAIMSIFEPRISLSVLNNTAAVVNAAKKRVKTVGRPKKDNTKVAMMNKSRLEKHFMAKSAKESIQEEQAQTCLPSSSEALPTNANSDFEFVDVNPNKRIKLMKKEETDTSENAIEDLEDDIKKLDGILSAEYYE